MIRLNKGKAFLDKFNRLGFSSTEQELAEQFDAKSFFSRAHESEAIRYGGFHFGWIGRLFNGIHIAAWNIPFSLKW